MFGKNPVSPEGVELKVRLTARRASFQAPGGREMSMEQFMREFLGGVRLLLPSDINYRVGLGFLDREGRGLEALVPLEDPKGLPAEALAKAGRLERNGDDMEGESHDFSIEAGNFPEENAFEIRLALSQGQIRFFAQDRMLLEELAGFPLEFTGFPSIACQNVRCVIDSVEMAWR
jgi:hypothetical protein